MKGDVLSGFKKLKGLHRLQIQGEKILHLPYNIEAENVTPVYTEMPGWKEDLTKMTNASQMPKALNNYIEYLEKELEVPIKIVSVGTRSNPDHTPLILFPP